MSSTAQSATDVVPALEIVMRENACNAGDAAKAITARANANGVTFVALASEIVRIDILLRKAAPVPSGGEPIALLDLPQTA